MVMWMVGGKRGINSLIAYFTNNFSNAKKINKKIKKTKIIVKKHLHMW